MKFDENGKRIVHGNSTVTIGLVGSSKAGTRGFENISEVVEYWVDLTQQANQDIRFASGGGAGTGYVVKSLEAALWAFYSSDSFEEGCLMAANLGDDAEIDSTARSVCKKFEVDFKEFKPDGIGWDANKKRNLQIANYCDKVISFALPFGTTVGVPKCFHCEKAGKDNNHEKTAGCYTGKACGAYEVVIL